MWEQKPQARLLTSFESVPYKLGSARVVDCGPGRQAGRQEGARMLSYPPPRLARGTQEEHSHPTRLSLPPPPAEKGGQRYTTATATISRKKGKQI